MSISATMIVRDEATVIEPCLMSLHGVVDEIVVVDTGSTDATATIAARYGATVVDIAWRDDFPAARNHAIERAGCDRLLYIDADERLRPVDRTALLAELADPGLVCATVHFRPRAGAGVAP